MNSLFKLNQLSDKQLPIIIDESSAPLDNRDKEIYALRQQLQALKTLYKNAKVLAESTPKNSEISSESNYSKQRIEKLMAALAEREKQMRTQQREAKEQLAEAIDLWQNEKQEVAALRRQLEFLKTKLTSSESTLKAQQEQLKFLLDEHRIDFPKKSEMQASEMNF